MAPWIFVVGGIASALVGAYFVRSGLRMSKVPDRSGWLVVPGEITEWRSGQRIGPPGEADVRHHPRYPVVRYHLPDGSLNVFVNRTTMDTGLYRTGGRVEVLVDPQDPRRAELTTSGSSAGGTWGSGRSPWLWACSSPPAPSSGWSSPPEEPVLVGR